MYCHEERSRITIVTRRGGRAAPCGVEERRLFLHRNSSLSLSSSSWLSRLFSMSNDFNGVKLAKAGCGIQLPHSFTSPGKPSPHSHSRSHSMLPSFNLIHPDSLVSHPDGVVSAVLACLVLPSLTPASLCSMMSVSYPPPHSSLLGLIFFVVPYPNLLFEVSLLFPPSPFGLKFVFCSLPLSVSAVWGVSVPCNHSCLRSVCLMAQKSNDYSVANIPRTSGMG